MSLQSFYKIGAELSIHIDNGMGKDVLTVAFIRSGIYRSTS